MGSRTEQWRKKKQGKEQRAREAKRGTGTQTVGYKQRVNREGQHLGLKAAEREIQGSGKNDREKNCRAGSRSESWRKKKILLVSMRGE